MCPQGMSGIGSDDESRYSHRGVERASVRDKGCCRLPTSLLITWSGIPPPPETQHTEPMHILFCFWRSGPIQIWILAGTFHPGLFTWDSVPGHPWILLHPTAMLARNIHRPFGGQMPGARRKRPEERTRNLGHRWPNENTPRIRNSTVLRSLCRFAFSTHGSLGGAACRRFHVSARSGVGKVAVGVGRGRGFWRWMELGAERFS